MMKAKLFLFLCCLLLSETVALADTVYLKDGKEIKGIILEEYKDRVVISTHKGKKTVHKKEVDKILYDLVEQNLIKLGDLYMSRRNFENAYFYYKKAYTENPRRKEARDKMNYALEYLFHKPGQEKLREVKKRQELENWPARSDAKDFEETLEDRIGIRIAESENRIKIKDVLKNSPAATAGLKPRDKLVSVWGRYTNYMSREEVARLLLEESFGEIKLTIERDIGLIEARSSRGNYQEIIGGKLNIPVDGLTLVNVKNGGPGQKAGLEKNDLIVAINGISTLYMPFREVVDLIKNSTRIVFTVRRTITLWRG